MPTYEYVCRACGHEFEKFQSMNDDPVKSCPECRRRQVKRKIGVGAGVIFKGSGFYETDYKKKPRPKGEKSGDDSSSKSSSESEGTSASKDSKKSSSNTSSGGSKKDAS
jgi:putative FmdB family regulatory protein